MELTKEDLKDGLKFIVGTWEAEFVVSFFSNNLEHVPVTEFKSSDGRDLSKLSMEFFEDHTAKLKDGSNGREVDSTWEQTKPYGWTYKANGFFGELPADVAEKVEELDAQEGKLCIAFGFLCIAFKKTAEGHITKEPDIDEIEPSPDDLKMKAIVGRWKVYKTLAPVGDGFGLHTKDEVMAEFDKKKAAGELDDEEYEQGLQMFNMQMEFTDDYQVLTYMPIPKHVTQEQIDQAVASGEVKIVDGMMCCEEPKEWKAVNGHYYYNTKEHREIFGEIKSPWDIIDPDADGRIDLKMFVLEKM
ncbi:MAG: hypothetical protein IKQ70_08060 [Bacteroidales bacterium]|nr:hypothetical protein [Bacteroidales bacterium]